MNIKEAIEFLTARARENPDQCNVDVLDSKVLQDLIYHANPLGLILWTRNDIRECVPFSDVPEGLDYEEAIAAIATRISDERLTDCAIGNDYIQDICEEYFEEIRQSQNKKATKH